MPSVKRSYEDPGTPEEITRRTFMANATLTLTGVVALGLAIPTLGSLAPRTGTGHGRWARLDDVGWKHLQSSTDTPVKIDFVLRGKDAYLPEASSGESVWGVKVDAAKFAKIRPDVFAKKGDEVPYPVVTMGFVLLSPICPHLGCRFDYFPDAGRFKCHCHGSQYGIDGQRLAGPAARGLDPLPLRERDGIAEVTWIRYAPTIPNRLVVSYVS